MPTKPDHEKNPAAVALGSIKSDAKKVSSPQNAIGNPGRSEQTLTEAHREKLKAVWAKRKADPAAMAAFLAKVQANRKPGKTRKKEIES